MFVAFLATSSVLPAAVLVDWNFASLPANLASQENVVASNPLLPSSEATVATGLTVTSIINVGSLQYSSANGPTTGTALAGELNLKNWDVAPIGSNNNYFAFTVSAQPGYTLSIDSVSISLWRNGGGAPNTEAWQVSIDGAPAVAYGSPVTVAASGLPTPFTTYTFTQTITGVQSVEFRFTPYAASPSTAGTGNLHINDIVVNGPDPVPEPGALALVGLSLAAVARRRR